MGCVCAKGVRQRRASESPLSNRYEYQRSSDPQQNPYFLELIAPAYKDGSETSPLNRSFDRRHLRRADDDLTLDEETLMEGKCSKRDSQRQVSSDESLSPPRRDNDGYQQLSYPQENPYYMPQHLGPNVSPHRDGSQTAQPNRLLDRKYLRIADNDKTLDEITTALAQAGLESSNLIVGIDFTKSNEGTGERSFSQKSLHDIGSGHNPYEQAISIFGKTLSASDEDNLIPCFGFGDASTQDQDVFSFYPDETFCNGFEEVLTRYREIAPHIRLAGPTSFAPIIEMAMTIVEQSGGKYHVLLIIANGQVTRTIDTQQGQFIPQEQKTIDAIVKASEYPLSIVLVGVGDGPWDMMKEFYDNIPGRAFDNFQFVNFTEIMSRNGNSTEKERDFALSALMKIPSQYKATIELGLLGARRGYSPDKVPLTLPPHFDTSPSGSSTGYDSGYDTTDSAETSSSPLLDDKVCTICDDKDKDMGFDCGHQTCSDCGLRVELCPFCRSRIQTRTMI